MPIPKFTELRPEIDSRLEAIIQKSLERDREQRYQSAFEMLHDLEVYLYSGGYRPTNEKLGAYLKALLAEPVPETLFTQ
jgi:serine/threonine-protein kinase